jgi:hypothetical protein
MATQFDGSTITSDAGVLLLVEVDKRIKLLERFAECFTDQRDARAPFGSWSDGYWGWHSFMRMRI